MNAWNSLLVFAVMCACPAAHAAEIYQWVDENGVRNFSQNAPPAGTEGVSRVALESSAPEYDPEEDIYNVAAQAERMQALRESMAEKRQARAEERRRAAQMQPVRYVDRYVYSRPGFWHPPYYPRPPVAPQPPAVQPLETRILIPPGSVRN